MTKWRISEFISDLFDPVRAARGQYTNTQRREMAQEAKQRSESIRNNHPTVHPRTGWARPGVSMQDQFFESLEREQKLLEYIVSPEELSQEHSTSAYQAPAEQTKPSRSRTAKIISTGAVAAGLAAIGAYQLTRDASQQSVSLTTPLHAQSPVVVGARKPAIVVTPILEQHYEVKPGDTFSRVVAEEMKLNVPYQTVVKELCAADKAPNEQFCATNGNYLQIGDVVAFTMTGPGIERTITTQVTQATKLAPQQVAYGVPVSVPATTPFPMKQRSIDSIASQPVDSQSSPDSAVTPIAGSTYRLEDGLVESNSPSRNTAYALAGLAALAAAGASIGGRLRQRKNAADSRVTFLINSDGTLQTIEQESQSTLPEYEASISDNETVDRVRTIIGTVAAESSYRSSFQHAATAAGAAFVMGTAALMQPSPVQHVRVPETSTSALGEQQHHRTTAHERAQRRREVNDLREYGFSAQEVADMQDISRSTVYRDVRRATGPLSRI